MTVRSLRRINRQMGSPTLRSPLRAVVLGLVMVVAFTSGAGAAVSMSSARSHSTAKELSLVFRPAHKVSRATLGETVRIVTHRLSRLRLGNAVARSRRGEVVVLLLDTKSAKKLAQIIDETGQVFVRPALCGAPAFSGKALTGAEPASAKLPACASASELTSSNLQDTVSSATTFRVSTVPADEALAPYPSTSPTTEKKTKTVLLPAVKGAGQFARYLLGPAAMTNHAFASAVAEKTQVGRWVVNYTLTSKGTRDWEGLAKARFHEVVAVDLDGIVQSAPLIEPSQSTFTSFHGRGEIAGNLTELDAQGLALAMQFGPLPVRMIHEATRIVRRAAGT
jgi:preprotein translocase subunit SecD